MLLSIVNMHIYLCLFIEIQDLAQKMIKISLGQKRQYSGEDTCLTCITFFQSLLHMVFSAREML